MGSYRMRKLVVSASALIVALSIYFLMGGCSWDKTMPMPGAGDGIKDSICFENEILPIIQTNCAKSGCHDAATSEEGYNLSNFWGVFSIVQPGNPDESKLIEVISNYGEDIMPPSPNLPLSSDQVDLIKQWILEGALPGIDCNVGGVCDLTNVTYSGTIVPILQNHCLGCHATSGSGGGILLNSWSDVKTYVNNGRLWGAINHSSSYVAMPQNAAKLSDCDIQKIGTWIDAGAPNN